MSKEARVYYFPKEKVEISFDQNGGIVPLFAMRY